MGLWNAWKIVQNRATTTKLKWKLTKFTKLNSCVHHIDFSKVKCLEECRFEFLPFEPLPSLNRWVCSECRQRQISWPAFSCKRVCLALRCCLRPGSIVLIYVIRSLPGKKFVNRDRISVSSVSRKHYYIPRKTKTLDLRSKTKDPLWISKTDPHRSQVTGRRSQVARPLIINLNLL